MIEENGNSEYRIIEINFLRIQTYLFTVPRLADMVGANSLLGQVIRIDLPNIVVDIGGQDCSKYDLPKPAPFDPLSVDEKTAQQGSPWIEDNPSYSYSKGVLSRDGGHFRAIFDKPEKAASFSQRAQELLRQRLSGLAFEINEKQLKQNPLPQQDSSSDISFLPQFQICQESGLGPANHYDNSNKRSYSLASKQKKQAYQHFREQMTHTQARSDAIAQLSSTLPQFSQLPQDLNELAGKSGYLAVIHADGNSIGKRLKNWQNSAEPTSLDQYLRHEAKAETFFHNMRVINRKALHQAINEVFCNYPGTVQPYLILMLGGDDLLFICQPDYAMSFVQAYSHALSQTCLIDGKPLSIGAGVVIAKSHVPFNRLHHQAEALASSAKQLFLASSTPVDASKQTSEHPERSVVDWMVSSNSWIDNPSQHRQQHEMVRYNDYNNNAIQLALLARPYYVLDQENSGVWHQSLGNLLKTSDQLRKVIAQGASRAQLKNFLTQLESGQASASQAYDEFPADLKAVLAKLLNINSGDDIWHSAGEHSYTTYIKDLIDLVEISLLGRQTQSSGTQANG